MRFEVEQKYRTEGHDDVVDRLHQLGASGGERVEHDDVYLNHPSRNFADTNEALRLRSADRGNALTYKGPKRGGPTKTREEIEVPFADGPEARGQLTRVFEALGFGQVAEIRKSRTTYRLTCEGREVEVALDVAEDLGTFVEVETIAEGDADLPQAQRVVVNLAARLGLSALEPRSYLRMALERRAEAAGG